MTPPLDLRAAAPPTTLRLCGASEGFAIEAEGGDPAKPKSFTMTAYTGGLMRVGLGYPAVVDLAGTKAPRQSMPVFRSHDPAAIVGHTVTIDVMASRIKAAGVLSGVGEAAAEVVALAANGFPWQASIGAEIERLEFVDRGSAVKVNGRNFDGPIYVVRAASLYEISFVPVGADTQTSASVAAHQGSSVMTFEAWLQARGIDPATLTAGPTRTALEAAFKAEPTPPPPPVPPTPPRTPDTLDDVLAQARQDNERQRQITEIVARAITEAGGNTAAIDTFERIGRLAIQGKWAVDRTELEILRAGRPAVPNVFAPSKPQASALVLEAAVCAAGGLKTLEKDYDAATLEAAHRQFKGGIGLQELILHCARSNGYREATVARDLKAALRTAFTGQDLRASGGASTLDISGILSNVANKFVREAWMFVESTWSKITAKRNVSDFKEITSYTLTGDLTYDKVAPGGEIKHGTLGEQSYTNQADTYAKLIGIDRRDLINDDLGALTQVGRRLGRGGALKLNDVFWTEFLADASTFYTAARGNYDDGAADTLMDLTGIANAHTLFMTLNDPDGKPTGTTPAIVLVPPALWPAAWTLLMSAALNLATSSAASTGTENPWKGMFRLETSRYLSNASFTGYSAAAWYLLADPSDLPVIETCFLNGVELPTVESADMDFDRLGVALRAYHDFGANKQEYRGGVKMKGAA